MRVALLALADLLHDLGVELVEIIGRARGDEAMVDHHGFILHVGPGILKIGLHRLHRRHLPALCNASGNQHLRPMADRKHRLAIIDKAGGELEGLSIRAQPIRIEQAARNQDRVIVIRARLIKRLVDVDRFALLHVFEPLDVAGLERDHLHRSARRLDRALGREQLALLKAIRRQDRYFLSSRLHRHRFPPTESGSNKLTDAAGRRSVARLTRASGLYLQRASGASSCRSHVRDACGGIFEKGTRLMHAYILLDRSGSMQGLWVEALSSVNAYAKELANKTDGDAVDSHVTLAVFDSQEALQFDVLRKKQPALHWEQVTDKDATPRGMTPLLDAIGRIVALAETDNPDKAVIVVMTDGAENASRELTREGVKAALDRVKKRGWDVVFLGANFDNIADASSVGVGADQQIAYAPGTMTASMA